MNILNSSQCCLVNILPNTLLWFLSFYYIFPNFLMYLCNLKFLFIKKKKRLGSTPTSNQDETRATEFILHVKTKVFKTNFVKWQCPDPRQQAFQDKGPESTIISDAQWFKAAADLSGHYRKEKPRRNTAVCTSLGDRAGSFAAKATSICREENQRRQCFPERAPEVCRGTFESSAEDDQVICMRNNQRPGRKTSGEQADQPPELTQGPEQSMFPLIKVGKPCNTWASSRSIGAKLAVD